MKQQIIVSGIGGQGVLFLTRVIAQVAVNRQIPVLVITSYSIHYTKLYDDTPWPQRVVAVIGQHPASNL